MPLSPIAEFVLRPIFELFFYGLGYMTGALLVPLFTLGAYTVESAIPSQRPRPKLRKRKVQKAAGLAQRTVSADAATTIGILFWAVVLVAGYFLSQASRT